MIDMKRARLIFRAREETIVTRELAVKLEEETPREIRRETYEIASLDVRACA